MPKINTHEKLLAEILDPSSYEFLRSKSYIGSREDFISCLLYALDATSAFDSNESLSEEEYLNMLTEQMNSVL